MTSSGLNVNIAYFYELSSQQRKRDLAAELMQHWSEISISYAIRNCEKKKSKFERLLSLSLYLRTSSHPNDVKGERSSMLVQRTRARKPPFCVLSARLSVLRTAGRTDPPLFAHKIKVSN